MVAKQVRFRESSTKLNKNSGFGIAKPGNNQYNIILLFLTKHEQFHWKNNCINAILVCWKLEILTCIFLTFNKILFQNFSLVISIIFFPCFHVGGTTTGAVGFSTILENTGLCPHKKGTFQNLVVVDGLSQYNVRALESPKKELWRQVTFSSNIDKNTAIKIWIVRLSP